MTTTIEDRTTGSLLGEHATSGRIFSGGWIEAPSTVDVVEPATGAVIGLAGVGDPADGRARLRRRLPGHRKAGPRHPLRSAPG